MENVKWNLLHPSVVGCKFVKFIDCEMLMRAAKLGLHEQLSICLETNKIKCKCKFLSINEITLMSQTNNCLLFRGEC